MHCHTDINRALSHIHAGVIPIAHNSGGPRDDIVESASSVTSSIEEAAVSTQAQRGYLCTTEAEYAQAIAEVLAMDQVSRLRIAAAARK